MTFTVPEARSTYISNEGVELTYPLKMNISWQFKSHRESQHIRMVRTQRHINESRHGIYPKKRRRICRTYHRLDKGTAGVLLVAKHPIAKTLFDRMIRIMKLSGNKSRSGRILKRPKGTINLPIGRDRHHSAKRRVSLSGQSAITHFRIIERKRKNNDRGEVETGRTHQIRVHLAHLGHPVTGDTLYDGRETHDGEFRLTATKLTFVHPFTNEQNN